MLWESVHARVRIEAGQSEEVRKRQQKENQNKKTAAMRGNAESQNETFVPESEVEVAFILATIET